MAYPHDDEEWPWPEDDGVECDHEEYDADILTGRAQCWRCGHSWYQTLDEIRQQERHEASYAAHIAELDHEENSWSARLRRWFSRWRKPTPDEIPF